MLTIGHPFELLSEVESTNNYIADHPRLADMSEGTAILTYNQTKGRGQRSRQWESEKDKDLAVSYLFRPNITPDKAFTLNKLIALALRACIAQLVPGTVEIKWPNDIYVDGRKVAGILIEPSWQGLKCRHAIVGIGINVNSKRDDSPWPAASLVQTASQELDLGEVFEVLNVQLQEHYSLLSEESEVSISEDFDQHLFGRNKEVEMISDGQRDVISIVGVDAYGRLRVKSDGTEQSYLHGEIAIDYSRIIGE